MFPMPVRACPLPDIAFILVQGEGARDFLDAQLGREVPSPSELLAPLAGWHDPQGRVRVLCRVLPMATGWLLLTPSDIAASFVQNLRRFVLRAKVSIEDATEQWRAAALIDADADFLARRGLEIGAQPNLICPHAELSWIRIGPRLIHVLGAPAAVAALLEALPTAPPELATRSEIELGLPSVTTALASHYLAQMLNLDLLGAVTFDKGCYPGQEVITRTHRLGRVKRRMHRFAAALEQIPAPGSRLLDAAGVEAGEVIRAAGLGGEVELLAVVRTDALDAPLAWEGAPRAALILRPLPYEVPDAA
jgi:tRNA-modifying protein YgfZ